MLDELTKILPPPKKPAKLVASSFADVEVKWGVALPADYKAFLETYGPGKLASFLFLKDPRDAAFDDFFRDVVGAMREAGDVPGPLFPEPGGLLPIGTTDNGDTIAFRTTGAPDGWSVVIAEGRGPETSEYTGTLTAFLVAVLRGQHECPVFPEDFPRKPLQFEPEGPKRLVVLIGIAGTETPFSERKQKLVEAFKKGKVQKDRSYSVGLDVGKTIKVQYVDTNPDVGGREGSTLSLTLLPTDEQTVRAAARQFVANAGLVVTEIVDFQRRPLWPEGL